MCYLLFTYTGRPLQVGLNSEVVRTGRRDTARVWTGPGQPPRRKIHTCSYCGYSTMYSTGLKRHMRSHTGYKPYACPHCEYSTITKYHLQRHIRIHNGQEINRILSVHLLKSEVSESCLNIFLYTILNMYVPLYTYQFYFALHQKLT